MDDILKQQLNNPLHGLKLKDLLQELVDHYGWEILSDQININCFKINPNIKSSLKFLRKTEWAREKIETFYLYKYKRLPKPDDEQYLIPARQRTIYLDQKPRSPAVIQPLPKEVKIQNNLIDDQTKQTTKDQLKNETSSKKQKSAVIDPWKKWK